MMNGVNFFMKQRGMTSAEVAGLTGLPERQVLEMMAEDIGYKDIRWDDIKEYYYPVGLSERKQDEAVLRKVQIDAGLAQIDNQKQGRENAVSQRSISKSRKHPKQNLPRRHSVLRDLP